MLQEFIRYINFAIFCTLIIQSFFLFQKGRNEYRSLLLGINSIAHIISTLFVIVNSYYQVVLDHFPAAIYFQLPFTLVWLPSFYFFTLACLFPGLKFRKRHLLHLFPFILFLALLVPVLSMPSEKLGQMIGQGSPISYLPQLAAFLIIQVQIVVYFTFILIRYRKYVIQLRSQKFAQESDLTLPWIKFVIFVNLGLCFVFILITWINAINNHFSYFLQFVLTLVSAVVFFLMFYRIITLKKNKGVFNVSKVLSDTSAHRQCVGIVEQLDQLILKKQLFLNPELRLKDLAKESEMGEREISQALNQIRKQNFSDYINTFRIEFAKKDFEKNPRKAVFEVMYDCGFNTKSAFNFAFKKYTQLSPTEFRKKAKRN